MTCIHLFRLSWLLLLPFLLLACVSSNPPPKSFGATLSHHLDDLGVAVRADFEDGKSTLNVDRTSEPVLGLKTALDGAEPEMASDIAFAVRQTFIVDPQRHGRSYGFREPKSLKPSQKSGVLWIIPWCNCGRSRALLVLSAVNPMRTFLVEIEDNENPDAPSESEQGPSLYRCHVVPTPIDFLCGITVKGINEFVLHEGLSQEAGQRPPAPRDFGLSLSGSGAEVTPVPTGGAATANR